ncbi:Cas10/Cmr2 second palm domain-containing protein [Saprospira grandis]|uniref:Cas10/Cmr2 second palm domain-containing protein n=1 Tax=Saprospira grandis TaxID=1008 RepID=UPI0022DD6D5D|nr:hypothetical protein [Saprospira grandis]WBM74943.1 hypothetical protein OP864_01635 [Saprospira grandis]
MSKKYLYSASVQGIQSFIFQTNKLKEIAGASELVEQLSTPDALEEALAYLGVDFKKENLIVAAAGKIKYLFDDLAACEKLCQYMPIYVSQEAPGLQLSQSVVLVDGAFKEEHYSRSEQALVQKRAFIGRPNTEGWMIAARAPQTGNPVKAYEKQELLDNGQLKKRAIVESKGLTPLEEKLLGKDSRYIFLREFAAISRREDNWLAVIYADGNDLGIKIPRLLKEREANPGGYQKASCDFSEGLDKANIKAFEKAKDELVSYLEEGGELEIDKETGKYKLPLRPIICGGDDLVVVIQARYALFFCETYLRAFEEKTKQKIDERLTACAGIAYIKSKYPFHYGFKLAKDLCTYAKSKSRDKNLRTTPASISFHKVETSFIRSYAGGIRTEEIQSADLISPQPYFIKELKSNEEGIFLDTLLKRYHLLKNEKDPQMQVLFSRIRKVLGQLNHLSESQLSLELERIFQLYYSQLMQLDSSLGRENSKDILKGAYDLLALKAIDNYIPNNNK